MAYLSHKVEKFQSPGCGDVNVINGFKPTFYNIHATPVPQDGNYNYQSRPSFCNPHGLLLSFMSTYEL